MTEWMANRRWLKKDKNRNIFLMRDHNYAFSAWEIGILDGFLKKNSTLVHVDAHLDDLPDGHSVPGILDEINTKEEAINLGHSFDNSTGEFMDRTYLDYANFIWPAVLRNTIGNIYYVSNYPQEELNIDVFKGDAEYKLHYENIVKHAKEISRFKSVEEFQYQYRDFKRKEASSSIILNLDLDYFNISYEKNPIIVEEKQIISNLETLRDIIKWDLIAVALSPECCGGESECQYILEIFMEVFEISYKDLIDW